MITRLGPMVHFQGTLPSLLKSDLFTEEAKLNCFLMSQRLNVEITHDSGT